MDDKWFRAQQKKAGITADQIAATLGRDRSVVSKILHGHQRMTLEWAQAFADALGTDVATILEKAGAARPATARQLAPGFAESDAAPFLAREGDPTAQIAHALGASRPGIDLWQIRNRAMALGGLLAGDMMLVDTHASERCAPGDTVIAQVYNHATASAITLIRRYEPPVLVAASCDPADQRVHIVDGANVVIRGKVIASWRV